MAKIFGTLDRAQLELLGSDPADLVGRIWFRTDTLRTKVGTGGGIVELADLSSTQTFSGKTYALGLGNDKVLISGATGNLSAEAQLAITRGGTGQATAAAAFGALSPLTTKGDILGYSTLNARVPIGTDTQVLTADSSQALGLKWATPASAPDQNYELSNLSITCSVGSNALTIALKDKGGSDPSAGSPVKIGFRSTTNSTGTYTQVSAVAATSLVISSGSTLGHTSNVQQYIWVYALNNAGTVELAASTTLFDTGAILSSSAEGGAGAADSNNVIYSTTARSNVAMRVIAKLTVTETTAGTWATAPSVVNTKVGISPIDTIAFDAQDSSTAVNVLNEIVFSTVNKQTHGAYSTSTGRFTAPIAGWYQFSSGITFNAGSGRVEVDLRKNGTLIHPLTDFATATSAAQVTVGGSTTVYLAAGDFVSIYALSAIAGTLNTNAWFTGIKVGLA